MGWTLTELDDQPDKKVKQFIQLMNIEAQAENDRKK
jgi:hypothetical protein